jgi:hypothetical protein
LCKRQYADVKGLAQRRGVAELGEALIEFFREFEARHEAVELKNIRHAFNVLTA